MSNKVSNIDVKRLNRNQVFRYINNHGRLSRPELAKALHMSSPTILFITNELIEKGVIREEGELDSTGGRKAKALMPIHDARCAIGLDITKSHISMVLTDLSGAVLRHIRIRKQFEHSKQYNDDIAMLLSAFMDECCVIKAKLLGVGLSLPGIIDVGKQQLVYSHILNVFDVPCDEFLPNCDVPVTFINDASAAALAELHNRQYDAHALYIALSNSVGGAFIFRNSPAMGRTNASIWQNSNLYMGDNFRGGEIGHMTLIPGGKPCYCGKNGCFDAYCSAKILAQHANGRLEDFFKELKAGNAQFKAEWETYLNYLAIQINSLRMLMDCKVIIGGYVGGYIEPYIAELKQRLQARDTFGSAGDYVEVSTYRFEAAALGAALLHIEAYVDTI